MSDPQRDTFVQLSALLTGFAADKLAPQLDTTDLAGTYLPLVAARTGAAFDSLLAQFSALSAGTPVSQLTAAQKQSIGEALLGLGGSSQDAAVAATALAINKLWYLGSWYQPFDYAGFTTDVVVGFVVSDQAYIKGLAWQAMQSHAMGYSPWTFGYWAASPPPLSAFTGNASAVPGSPT
ncbi:MAG TPA: sorbitol dehydrogenase [Thermoanaerobaculia bacterium]|nr:sorbitol dehydrogenase [Thermoanaerobaculia bacterium]